MLCCRKWGIHCGKLRMVGIGETWIERLLGYPKSIRNTLPFITPYHPLISYYRANCYPNVVFCVFIVVYRRDSDARNPVLSCPQRDKQNMWFAMPWQHCCSSADRWTSQYEILSHQYGIVRFEFESVHPWHDSLRIRSLFCEECATAT